MSDKEKKYDDPTNHVVSVFDNTAQAQAAESAFVKAGWNSEDIHILSGERAASEIDTSAKWFADTDKEIKKYKQDLLNGNIVLSVPVMDSQQRELIHETLKAHAARHITHFGEWITEAMR